MPILHSSYFRFSFFAFRFPPRATDLASRSVRSTTCARHHSSLRRSARIQPRVERRGFAARNPWVRSCVNRVPEGRAGFVRPSGTRVRFRTSPRVARVPPPADLAPPAAEPARSSGAKDTRCRSCILLIFAFRFSLFAFPPPPAPPTSLRGRCDAPHTHAANSSLRRSARIQPRVERGPPETELAQPVVTYENAPASRRDARSSCIPPGR